MLLEFIGSQVVNLPLKSAPVVNFNQKENSCWLCSGHVLPAAGQDLSSAATSCNEKRGAQPRIAESSLTSAGARQGVCGYTVASWGLYL